MFRLIKPRLWVQFPCVPGRRLSVIHWLITYNFNTNIVDIRNTDGDHKDDFPLWEVHIKKVDNNSTLSFLESWC